MQNCKTCAYWVKPASEDRRANYICNPIDPDTHEPMQRGFECRECKQPTQAFAESPVEVNGFALVDGSEYYATLVTAESFGCVRHRPAEPPVV